MENAGVLTDILISDAITADDKYVWILSIKKGLIVKIEKISGYMYPCIFIPNDCNSLIPYRFMFLYDNKLYLLPYEERKFAIYDICQKKIQYIDINMKMFKGKKYCYFSSYVLVGNLAIITGKFSQVLFWDLKTNMMNWVELQDAVPTNVIIEYWVWQYSYVNDNRLYLLPLMSPYIFIVDIETAEVVCKKIPDDNCQCFDNPVFTEDSLYYFNRSEGGAIISEYNIITNELKKYEIGIGTSDLNFRANGYVVYSNNALWCFPAIIDRGYRFSKNEVEEIKTIPVIEQKELGGEYPYKFNYRNGFLTDDGHILMVQTYTEQLVDVDTYSGEIKITKIVDSIDANWEDIYISEFRDLNSRVVREWKDGMLATFVDYIVSGE